MPQYEFLESPSAPLESIIGVWTSYFNFLKMGAIIDIRDKSPSTQQRYNEWFDTTSPFKLQAPHFLAIVEHTLDRVPTGTSTCRPSRSSDLQYCTIQECHMPHPSHLLSIVKVQLWGLAATLRYQFALSASTNPYNIQLHSEGVTLVSMYWVDL